MYSGYVEWHERIEGINHPADPPFFVALNADIPEGL